MSSLDFSSMMFSCDVNDVNDIPGVDQLEIPEDLPAKFRLPFVRYHLYLYDKESPLITKYRELDKRQTAAFKEAGIWDDPFHKENMDPMRRLQYEGQVPLIISILKAQNNATWNALVVNEVLHQKIIFDILDQESEETSDLDKQAKLLDKLDEVVRRIEAYYQALFGSVHEEERSQIKIRIRPETLHMFKE